MTQSQAQSHPVAIVGATGFLGAEILRLALAHPNLKVASLAGASSAGKDLREIRPGFAAAPPLPVHTPDPHRLAAEAKTVFLALPHGESAPLAEKLLEKGATVIDLGSDFRLKNPADVQTYYQRSAPPDHLLSQAVYSLPELTGPPPPQTKLVACPGCFATALNLLLAILAPLRLPDLTVFGVTGSSGSGISPAPGVHHSLRNTNFVAYKPLAHQHIGEVLQLQAERGHAPRLHFVPHSAPLVRGIHLTTVVPAPAQTLRDSFQNLYAQAPFLTLQEGTVPLASVVHTNRAAFALAESLSPTGQTNTTVTVAIDNLLKGGSGQAVQILNLLLGLPETTALPLHAPWP